MSCSQATKLAGSISLDEAVQALYPDAARWDYGIGLTVNQRDDRVIWVEVHPVSTGDVKDMIKKLLWLKSWLTTSAPIIRRLSNNQFHWIATSGVRIPKNSPKAKMLAQSGIRYPTKHLLLDKC